MNHIELFAGCGGLSLGLHAQKFKLLFANELSPMAAETFAYNLLKENLSAMASMEPPPADVWRTKWLSSQFPRSQLALRLREDPQKFPPVKQADSELGSVEDLQNSLIVGSIIQLNQWLSRVPKAALGRLRNGFGDGEVDLVSGGPPCQSFSMNGLRDYKNSRNVLPWEFAKFVELAQPRFALLENVTGILRPFQVAGKPVYAWFEVAKAFAEIGYVPLCLHVNAKYAGVAQNRPRFLMILFREDVFKKVNFKANPLEKTILRSARVFFEKQKNGEPTSIADLTCFDVEKPDHLRLYRGSFLRSLVAWHEKTFTVAHAIDDLSILGLGTSPSAYVKLLDDSLGKSIPMRDRANNDHRNHGHRVRRRFRIYQNMVDLTKKSDLKEMRGMLSGKLKILSNESFASISQLHFTSESGDEIKFQDKAKLEKYLVAHATKKQKQCSLEASSPAPAALSIPDDACHYREPRTLSVREMARIQSFPDNFEFRSKVTTGGDCRKYEVPQYTQVGNAVPPLLGVALGRVFHALDAIATAASDHMTDMPEKAEYQLA